jgi:hypothetical protein
LSGRGRAGILLVVQKLIIGTHNLSADVNAGLAQYKSIALPNGKSRLVLENVNFLYFKVKVFMYGTRVRAANCQNFKA